MKGVEKHLDDKNCENTIEGVELESLGLYTQKTGLLLTKLVSTCSKLMVSSLNTSISF